MLGLDWAGIGGVPTRRLNEPVRLNRGRFRGGFMFQRTRTERAEAQCIG